MSWLASTSNRTFFVMPLLIAAFEAARQHGMPHLAWYGVPLMAWGYAQYHIVGRYRTRLGGGGPGLAVPPERLVTTGPYAWLRNPMYAGHLVYLAGAALVLRSWFGAALWIAHAVWFDLRVRKDERRLRGLFVESYEAYCRRVARWLPGLW